MGEPTNPTFDSTVAAREPVYLFPRIYLQTGVASLIVIVGAIFLFRFVGTKPSSVDFLIATDGEMKKVNWSTKKVIKDSTMVVIGATFLIAGYIFLVDTFFSHLVRFLRIIET